MTIRRTASMARLLWYGSLAAGALIGGGIAVAVVVHLTTKES